MAPDNCEFLDAYEVCALDDSAIYCREHIGFFSSKEIAIEYGKRLHKPHTIRSYKVLKLPTGEKFLLHIKRQFEFDE